MGGGHKETLGGDEYVYYFDYGRFRCRFFVYQLYINKAVEKNAKNLKIIEEKKEKEVLGRCALWNPEQFLQGYRIFQTIRCTGP